MKTSFDGGVEHERSTPPHKGEGYLNRRNILEKQKIDKLKPKTFDRTQKQNRRRK